MSHLQLSCWSNLQPSLIIKNMDQLVGCPDSHREPVPSATTSNIITRDGSCSFKCIPTVDYEHTHLACILDKGNCTLPLMNMEAVQQQPWSNYFIKAR